MTENRATEETVNEHCDSRMPHILTSMENRQIQESPRVNARYTLASINNGTAFNFGVRTAERSRIFASNISSTIQGIRPLIQQAAPNISLTSLLTIHGIRNQVHPVALPNDSHVINVEEPVTNDVSSHDEPVRNHHHHVGSIMSNNFSDNTHEAENEIVENHNNNNTSENSSRNVQISPEARGMLKQLQRYVPFIIILLVKSLYDYRLDILMYAVPLFTFITANGDLKREIAKQQNRSRLYLMLMLCFIIACIVFIVYVTEYNFYTLIPYAEPLTIWDLLCYVIMMDFFLKFITIICKVFLTCLPIRLLAFRNRGKYYLMVEATSQLYRCVAPVQPWLYYLLETYQGSEKFMGILFSTMYTLSKGSDLLSRIKLFYTAAWKLFENVSYGVSPSEEQLIASGGICTICHEEYTTPLRLHCKHIFCETCVLTWLDRERSCPLCRASITDDPIYQNGHTTYFIHLY